MKKNIATLKVVARCKQNRINKKEKNQLLSLKSRRLTDLISKVTLTTIYVDLTSSS